MESHVKSQQRKLSCVVSVMADHKKRQSKNFKFSLPVNNEVHTLSHQCTIPPITTKHIHVHVRIQTYQFSAILSIHMFVSVYCLSVLA